MYLRSFTISDAPTILSWIKDKTAFRKWSADRYPVFPPKPEDMAAQYAAENIFPFTAVDGEGNIVGHIMLRYPEPSKTIIRLGFVIIDDQLRGKGYGKQMLQLAILKAKLDFGAQKITLGVFDNNPSAIHCYESVGFVVTGTDTYAIDGMKERFKFNTVGLFTRDNKATVDFYTKTFGFTTDWDGIQPNVEMMLGDMRIILFPRDAFEKMVSRKFQYPEGFNGTVELAFDVPTFADVDKEYQNALNNGAKPVLVPTTEPWGQRTCYIADPDGNLIEIGSFVEG